MRNYQRPVYSNPTVDFLEALTTNQASATVNLPLPTRDAAWFVQSFTLVSVENLEWELQVFSSADNLGGTVATAKFIGSWQFVAMVAGPPASPGYPVDQVDASPADALYKYYIDGNMIPYLDEDQLSAASQASGGTYPNNAHLHIRLVNRSSASKSANAGGAVQLTAWCAPQGQQV
jgi:hypothetical protein